ncbi:MAG: hypothetical protein QOJ60_2515 [Actinomycetota bacterium]|nr:hypothetical protein [Actinomycetota bacterium]
MRDALRGLTTRGRSFLAAGIAVVIASVAVGQDDLMRIGVLLVALPLLSAWVVARTRYRLASSRRLSSPRTAAGQDSSVTLGVENISRLPTGLLLVEDRVPYVLGSRPRFVLDRVEPRGHREVTYIVRSDVRGRYVLGPMSIRLTDPFGLCELHRSFHTRDTLVITPQVHRLPTVQLAGEWAGSGESRARAIATAGEDDAATREYRQGDDLRRVHWRSTARLGQLMVRREEQPWQSRCTILLDTRTRAHAGDGPASSFEWAVSAAASIGVHLVRHGYHVRLLTDAGGSVASAAHDPSGIGSDFEGALLDALAVVNPSRHESFDDAARTLRRGGGDGLLIAILGIVDPQEAHQLARLRQGTTSAVALLLDSGAWTTMPEAARATMDRAYDGSAALMSAAGWRVVLAGPSDTVAGVWPDAGRGSSRPATSVGAPR